MAPLGVMRERFSTLTSGTNSQAEPGAWPGDSLSRGASELLSNRGLGFVRLRAARGSKVGGEEGGGIRAPVSSDWSYLQPGVLTVWPGG
jgi:hypothetical protein